MPAEAQVLHETATGDRKWLAGSNPAAPTGRALAGAGDRAPAGGGLGGALIRPERDPPLRSLGVTLWLRGGVGVGEVSFGRGSWRSLGLYANRGHCEKCYGRRSSRLSEWGWVWTRVLTWKRYAIRVRELVTALRARLARRSCRAARRRASTGPCEGACRRRP